MKQLQLLLGLAVLLSFCGIQQANAQQRRTAARTGVSKKVSKKTTQKKSGVSTATPVAISISDPVVVNGSTAFLGISVKQPTSVIEKQLTEKGFVKKQENGYTFLKGTAYGCQVKVFINENQIVVHEVKAYTKAQARKRIDAYKKAFSDATNVKVTENTMTYNSDEGGNYVLEVASGGSIDLHYYNQDEVNFDSKFFDVILTFTQN